MCTCERMHVRMHACVHVCVHACVHMCVRVQCRLVLPIRETLLCTIAPVLRMRKLRLGEVK